MQPCTHSLSGISRPKKRDPKNVADPPMPPCKLEMQKKMRSKVASQAWKTCCNDQFHLSLDMAPKWQTWAQHVSWPPSHWVCLRHGKLSEVVSRLILKLREVVPLVWETTVADKQSHQKIFEHNLGLKLYSKVT